jgi:5'-3' exonuclease
MLDHDAMEADDLIALSVKEVKAVDPNTVVVVVTNDNDYIQLLEHDIILINLQKKMLQERIHEPETYLKRKIIMGDKSDNIPAIMKKCGEKTACKLVADPEALNTALQDPVIRQQYDLNSLLVDFANIPAELVTAFKDLWQARKNLTAAS